MEQEIKGFFSVYNTSWVPCPPDWMPESDSFVHSFFCRMGYAIPETAVLEDAQLLPHPENNYLIPQDGYPKDANQFILFANTDNFRGFAAELGKRGKAFVFA